MNININNPVGVYNTSETVGIMFKLRLLNNNFNLVTLKQGSMNFSLNKIKLTALLGIKK